MVLGRTLENRKKVRIVKENTHNKSIENGCKYPSFENVSNVNRIKRKLQVMIGRLQEDASLPEVAADTADGGGYVESRRSYIDYFVARHFHTW